MSYKKLQDAVSQGNYCCAYALITKNHSVKAVMRYTDASDRAIKIWRRDVRLKRHLPCPRCLIEMSIATVVTTHQSCDSRQDQQLYAQQLSAAVSGSREESET